MATEKNKLFVPVDKVAYSATALCPQAPMNSSSRKYMFFTQMGNAVSCANPDVPYILSGLEKEFREMNYHHRISCQFRVLYILPYFEKDIDIGYAELSDATYVNVVYHNLDDDKIDYIRVMRWGKKDKTFGYNQKWTEKLMNLQEGGIYPKTDLTETNAEKDGVFAYGKNIPILFCSKAEVAEDAFYVSETFNEKFKTDLYRSYQTYSDGRYILLNRYGDKDNYIPLPKVGDKVPDDGIVMALRELKDDNFLSNCSIRDLSYIDYTHDKLYKVASDDATVIDINVLYNPDGKKSNVLNFAHDDLIEYAENKKRYDMQFISRCKDYVEKHKLDFGNDLYVELIRLQKFYHPKVDKMIKKKRIPTFTIDITVKYTRKGNIGFKYTTLHGSKGVESVIVPDHMMPIDANGIRSEIMIVSNSNMHRMNMGNPAEGYVGSAIHILDKRFKSVANRTKGTLKDRVSTNFKELDRLFLGFLHLVNPQKVKFMLGATEQQRASLYASLLKTHLSFPIPLDVKGEDGNVMSYDEIMQRIDASEFRVKSAPITYTLPDGTTGKTVKPSHMHMQYMFALNKIADDGLVVASARLNPLGLPVAPPTSQKDGDIINEKPTKISETETRFFASYCHPALLAEFRDRSLAMPTKYHIARKLLDVGVPTNIDVIVDRTQIKFGEDVVLKTLNGIVQSVGLTLKGVLRDKYREESK
jgi:DNA-directed RNA polymerase beta subunit